MLNLLPNTHESRPLRVLCLGAHSDDVEIGCGGTLMQLLAGKRPVEVRWVVFSGNRSRAAEATASAERWLAQAAAKQIDLHSFRDGFFPDEWAAVKDVFEQLKGSFDPDIIFTHCENDLHQDHQVINQLTWNTFRDHFVLAYEIPKYDGDLDAPAFFVPLPEEVAREKVAALMEYFSSQHNKHWFSEELFLGLMRIRGMEACAPSGYAEGFHVRKACLGI